MPHASFLGVLSALAFLAGAIPTMGAQEVGALKAQPIPPETESSGSDACMPELAALAMMQEMAKAMGKNAEVLVNAEEELRSQAADCLDDDNLTEISRRIVPRPNDRPWASS